MKRTGILAVSCLLLISLNSQAQLRTAIVGGVQQSSVPGNNSTGWDTISYNYSSRNGIRAGILVDIPFSSHSKLGLQSGLYYTNKGRNFSAKFDTASSTLSHATGKQYVNNLEIPLNLVLKLKLGKKTNLVMGAGPYASFLFSGLEQRTITNKDGSLQSLENTDMKITTAPGMYNNIEYGVNGTLGFEFGRFIVSGHYSEGLSDFYSNGNAGAAFKHRTMGASVGFYLSKASKRTEKIRDRDKDGIPDSKDICPDVRGIEKYNGCPIPDRDKDGVNDELDVCPDEPGIEKYAGCAIPDSDNDGVNNEEDHCPDIPGSPKYHGCPIPDTDKDGINDEEDKCPDVKGLAKYGGCPIPDTDNDGVNDEQDKCPTVKGLKTNKGCPPVKKEIVQKVNSAAKRIHFNYKSVLLTEPSKKVLLEVVKLLKDNPELNVSIEGHTSIDGNPANHDKLSEARAYSVKIYLESKGIAPDRLSHIGYGASKPLVKGSTEAAYARNRRVEMILSNN